MLDFLFAVTVLVAGIKCNTDTSNNCIFSPHEACEFEHHLPDMPGTAEELDEACKLGIPRLECGRDHLEKCSPGSPGHQNMVNALPVIREICDKDNVLHDVIGSNLPCLKENNQKLISCVHRRYVDLDDVYEKLIEAQGIGGISRDDSECLKLVYRMACVVAAGGQNCGEEVKDAIVETLQRVMDPLETCPPVIREHFAVIVNVMIMGREQQEILENDLDEE